MREWNVKKLINDKLPLGPEKSMSEKWAYGNSLMARISICHLKLNYDNLLRIDHSFLICNILLSFVSFFGLCHLDEYWYKSDCNNISDKPI